MRQERLVLFTRSARSAATMGPVEGARRVTEVRVKGLMSGAGGGACALPLEREVIIVHFRTAGFFPSRACVMHAH